MKHIVLAVLAVIFLSAAVSAQDDDGDHQPGKDELMVWGGFAPAVRTFDDTGRTWDAQYGIVALRYSHRWNTSKWLNIKYTLDAVPAAFLHYPDRRITSTGVTRVKETRYAFGGSPFGLQFNIRPKKKVQPFFGLSLGALIFNKTTPNDTGKRLNFSTEGGVGIEYRLKEKKALTFGYKFYHISNASRGIENPGYDAQLFYVGYTFFSK